MCASSGGRALRAAEEEEGGMLKARGAVFNKKGIRGHVKANPSQSCASSRFHGEVLGSNTSC